MLIVVIFFGFGIVFVFNYFLDCMILKIQISVLISATPMRERYTLTAVGNKNGATS